MSAAVTLQKNGDIAVVTIDNPPVNAFSRPVRVGLLEAFAELAPDTAVKAVVLRCSGRSFVAGADIAEFAAGTALDPDPSEVHRAIENLGRPVVAAIHGSALGGGLELALACHYRIAAGSARLGLPEVNLGLLPGAGGTQRTPRLIGAEAALAMMLSGASVPAQKALALGLVDAVTDGDLQTEAEAFAARLAAAGGTPRKSSLATTPAPAATFFADARAALSARERANPAKERIIDCVQAALDRPFADGLALEREVFVTCMNSPESVALQRLFFAEREAARIPGLDAGTQPRRIGRVGIVGAGTMGGGIAMCFVNAGIPVRLLEVTDGALGRGLDAIRKNYEISASRGRMTAAEVGSRMAAIAGTLDYADFGDCDLVIEAVFENLSIKKEVCVKLGAVCRPGALIATNTSTLDVDVLAAASGRPEDFLGMHFFSPANVMRLLEIVRGAKTAPDVLATALAVARKISKVGVISGVCYGFIGNRMLEGYLREAEFLLLEGASPQQVDGALETWGMAMGPHRMMDLAGVDVGAKVLLEWQKSGGMPAHPAYRAVGRRLAELGRHGQKTGAGYYRYTGRTAEPDPDVMQICANLAAQHGIHRRSDIGDEEILRRCLLPLINEGARILEEGTAYRPGDIDVVWASGYGFPAVRGGPMHQAEVMGLGKVVDDLEALGNTLGNHYGWWTPAALLRRGRLTGS